MSGWFDMYMHRKPDFSATGSAIVLQLKSWYGEMDSRPSWRLWSRKTQCERWETTSAGVEPAIALPLRARARDHVTLPQAGSAAQLGCNLSLSPYHHHHSAVQLSLNEGDAACTICYVERP